MKTEQNVFKRLSEINQLQKGKKKNQSTNPHLGQVVLKERKGDRKQKDNKNENEKEREKRQIK